MDIPEKRIRIDPLPDNLCCIAQKKYGGGARTLEGMITFIRHYMSNYDAIRKETHMDMDATDRLRDTVNYLIERALLSWHRRRRKQFYKGLRALSGAHWLIANEDQNDHIPSHRWVQEQRRSKAVTPKVDQD